MWKLLNDVYVFFAVDKQKNLLDISQVFLDAAVSLWVSGAHGRADQCQATSKQGLTLTFSLPTVLSCV